MSNKMMSIIVAILLLFILASSSIAEPFQCVSGNVWKNESGGYFDGSGVIASVWVKAGQGCYELPHACYEIVSGGVGYTYVEVVDKAGDGCQNMSHLEGHYQVEEPTDTPTDVPTNTPTLTSTPVPSETPEPTETPTDEPTKTPTPFQTPTPWPTKPCTNPGGCNGLG
jgi:hypothetical protein